MDCEDLFSLARDEEAFRPTSQDIGLPHYRKRMNRHEREYVEFCKMAGISIDPQRVFEPPPPLKRLVAFLRYQARTKRGTNDPATGKIVVRTLEKNWQELRLHIRRQTGHEYSLRDAQDVTKMINNGIKQSEGLSSKARRKDLADHKVTRDVLQFLWELDEHHYEHPRVRVQIATAILFLHLMGLRPGEFVESKAHPGSNEGLHYGDMSMMLVSDGVGERLWVAQFRIRNKKGKRDRDDKVTVENLREDKSARNLCPISLLMALAIADEAFEGVCRVEDLDRVRFNKDRPIVVLRIKEEKRSLPILRVGNEEGGISPTRIWRADTLSELLVELGWRAGYKGKLHPYAFRRGHGNSLDQFVSSVQRRRQMGHKSDDTFMAYISMVSGVDVQNIINQRAPDQDFIDYLRSMQPHIDHGAPKRSSTFLANGSRRDHVNPDFIEERNHYLEAENDIYAGTNTTDPFTTPVNRPPPSRFLLSYLKHDQDRASLLRLFEQSRKGTSTALVELVHPLSLICRPSRQLLYYPFANSKTQEQCGYCGQKCTRTRRTEFNLHLLKCHRKALAESAQRRRWSAFQSSNPLCLWKNCKSKIHLQSPEHVLEHFLSHIKRRFHCAWGKCRQKLPTNHALLRHLVRKHRMPIAHDLLGRAQYCYTCSEYFVEKEAWEAHCATHLNPIDPYCGKIVRRDIVIRARLCPFCLADTTMSAAQRYRQWTGTSSFFNHMMHHLRTNPLSWRKCPLCSSSFASEASFCEHMKTSHGISRYKEVCSGRPEVELAYDSAELGCGVSEARSEAGRLDLSACSDASEYHETLILSGDDSEPIDGVSPISFPAAQQLDDNPNNGYDSETRDGASNSIADGYDRLKDVHQEPILGSAVNSRTSPPAQLDRHEKPSALLLCGWPDCDYGARLSRDMANHMIKVHQDSPYKCLLPDFLDPIKTCGKLCRDNDRLRRHQETHDSTGRLACGVGDCKHVFVKMEVLLRHRQQTHEGLKLFGCHHLRNSRRCRSAFDANHKLTRHIKKYHPDVA